jgi:hypothetical protein
VREILLLPQRTNPMLGLAASGLKLPPWFAGKGLIRDIPELRGCRLKPPAFDE